MRKFKIGYTQGVYDMFHVGHLNLINHAKEYCETLVVGINTDRLVKEYKHKTPVINQNNRRMIVDNIKAVDKTILVDTLNKVDMFNIVGFDVVFIGDDWKDNSRWIETQKDLAQIGVEVIFLPHTSGISSTDLRKVESKSIKE